jgi:hypothetical protein
MPITVNIFQEKAEGNLSKEVVAALKRKEGYYIEVSGGGVRLLGSDELGVLYGLTTLKKMAINRGGKIPRGHVLDWPDHKYRLLHITVINLSVKDAKDLIVKASESKFNGLIMEFESGWTELSSLKVQPIRKPELEKPLTKEDLKEILRFARENGLEVIPELKLLTHQDKFFRRYYPELMYNAWTYDPRKEETYSVVLPVLDEVIGIVNPRAVHIGHDEVAGADPGKKILNEDEKALPPELFLKDVMRLHSYLKERGIETWMWGDMLLGKEEFPGMLQRHLHGASGYASLRGRIPKDIVIVDWHYADDQSAFPSASAFAESGHRVLGSTWKKDKTIRNFSRYVANMPAGAGEGMVATTWAHVPKKEWGIVDNIIEVSGEAFWNAR